MDGSVKGGRYERMEGRVGLRSRGPGSSFPFEASDLSFMSMMMRVTYCTCHRTVGWWQQESYHCHPSPSRRQIIGRIMEAVLLLSKGAVVICSERVGERWREVERMASASNPTRLRNLASVVSGRKVPCDQTS